MAGRDAQRLDSLELAAFGHAGLRFGSATYLGNENLLRLPLLALFCSVRCPGTPLLRLCDFARDLASRNVPVIGGFHTPAEKECLEVLLHGGQPIVWCPARSLAGMRIPTSLRPHIATERFLVLSPFPPREKRATTNLAEARNQLTADLARQVLIAYAAPAGRLESLAYDLLKSRRTVHVLPLPENDRLLAAGCIPIANAGDLIGLKSPP